MKEDFFNPFVPIAAAALFSFACSLQAQTTYEIDPAHSSAQFAVKHMMVSTVRGEFSKLSGTVAYDPDHLATSKVDATIDASTLNTREPDRDKHLKSPDFFDVAKYPTMTFQSTSFDKDNGRVVMKGNLTIHGVTKPVTFALDGPSPEQKDPRGNMRRGATATTTVNRKDFGMVWNKTLDGGGVMLGDDVTITLDIEAAHKA